MPLASAIMYRSASRLGFLKHGAIPIELAAARGQRELVEMLFPRTKPIPSLPVWSVDEIMNTDRVSDIDPQRQASSCGFRTGQTAAGSNAAPPEFSLPGFSIPPELNPTLLGGRGLFPSGPVSSSISSAELKGEATKCMGHQVLGCCKSSVRMLNSKRMPPLGTQKRTFSSMIHEAPVIRQLMCKDDYEIKNEKWSLLAECLVKDGGILKPITPTVLMRAEDVITCGDYETGPFGVDLLRQASGLVAVNLMRGRNVSEIMKMENLLWSSERRILMFKECYLVGDDEGTSCPYRAVYDTFDRAVELTTGYKLEDLPHALPWYLDHYLNYLLDASLTDKRLITNHSATRYPGERMQRNMTMNHVLRRKLGYEFGYPGWLRCCSVLEELGGIFPEELLTAEGLHPAIDYWARKATENRGDFAMFPHAASPVVSPMSTDGNELVGQERKVALGRILVALMRNPFEHPYEPAFNLPAIFNGKGPYNLLDIENLLNNFVPRYGPTAEASFLIWGLSNHLETDDSNKKAPYYYYTDIGWETRCDLVTSRNKPAECAKASAILLQK